MVAATDENRFAGFWQAIEHIAWRRYWKRRDQQASELRTSTFFRKGLLRSSVHGGLLKQAFDAFVPSVSDWSKVNDDTAVLRWVAEREAINIAPAYSCTYHARGDLWEFLRHAYHRGAVLIDGYLRPGTRFAKPISIVLVGSPVVVVYALAHPVLAVGMMLGGSLTAGIRLACLVPSLEDAVTFGVLVVPFSIVYVAGMYRGASACELISVLQGLADRPCLLPREDIDPQLEGPRPSFCRRRRGLYRKCGVRARGRGHEVTLFVSAVSGCPEREKVHGIPSCALEAASPCTARLGGFGSVKEKGHST